MKHLSLLPLLLLAASCGQSEQQAMPGEPTTAALAVAELSPAQAYDRYCAGCHEQGIDGAPRTGDRAAWSGRSWLWEAVLFEHAKSGYLDMPAKGGNESLADATVSRAAEYMLTLTYPEAHRSN
jgi:cytochrome c5